MKTWTQLNSESLRYVNYADRKFKKALRNISINHAANVAEYGEAAILSQANIKEAVSEAYQDVYAVTGVAAAKSQIALTKSLVKDLQLKEEIESLEIGWARRMREFAVTRCGNKITAVTRHIYEDIEKLTKQVVAEAATQGWGAARVAREISKRSQVVDNMRAMRIARTEVIGAQNEGRYLGAGSYSINQYKIWTAEIDSKTRDGHREMGLDGAKVDYDEKFEVMGEDGIDLMDYPGDPSASAGNVINCRCHAQYVPKTSVIDQLLNE